MKNLINLLAGATLGILMTVILLGNDTEHEASLPDNDAYRLGRDSCNAGVSPDANPYVASDTPTSAGLWLRGWIDARNGKR